MSLSTAFVVALSCVSLCSCQFMQPRKFLERILELHEQSRNVLSGGDSMRLNVDLTSAKDFPVRDDLFLRVFNKENNITLCETRLFDHVEAGSFPCSFNEDDARLRYGANNFALEVFSNVNWKVYATQKIPDIHYFNTVAYEGHYDNFIDEDEIGPYAKKIVIVSVIAALLALLIHTGPIAVAEHVRHVLVDVVGAQIMVAYRFAGSMLKYIAIGFGNGAFGAFSLFVSSVQFLYNIFSSGLASPFSMLVSGLIYLTDVFSSGLKSSFVGLGSTLWFLYDIFSSGLASPVSMLQSAAVSSVSFVSGFGGNSLSLLGLLFGSLNGGSKAFLLATIHFFESLSANLVLYSAAGFKGLYNFPKFSFLVFAASAQFLFDIFYAGLGSPAGMIVSGAKSIGAFAGQGFEKTINGVYVGGASATAYSLSVIRNFSSGLFKSSVLLSDALNTVLRLIFYLSTGSAKNLQLLFVSMIKFSKGVPKSCLLSIAKTSYFLYDIFSSGLASPCGMLVGSCSALATVLGVGTASAYRHSSSAFTLALQSIFKTYKNVVSSCLFAIFGGFNLVGGGFQGISTGCSSFFTLLFSLLKFLRSSCFRMIFANSNAAGGSGPGSGSGQAPPKSQLKKWTKGSGSAPTKTIFVMEQPTYASLPLQKERESGGKKAGVAALGLLCALFIVAPGKSRTFIEPIQTSVAMVSSTTSSTSSTSTISKKKPKTGISKTDAFSNLIKNFMANRRNPKDIPAGCPLRRAGFF